MRFLEDGADIPDELIRTVTNGDAVFLCGAGVSMRVGLPSFKGLTERVYQKLGESYTNEFAEEHAFGRAEYGRERIASILGRNPSTTAGTGKS